MSSRKPAKKSHKDSPLVADMLTSQRHTAQGAPMYSSPSDMETTCPAITLGIPSEASCILYSLAEVNGILAAEIAHTEAEVKEEVTALEPAPRITDLEIEVEDVSNRSRRNNLLRGLHETVGEADLESLSIVRIRPYYETAERNPTDGTELNYNYTKMSPRLRFFTDGNGNRSLNCYGKKDITVTDDLPLPSSCSETLTPLPDTWEDRHLNHKLINSCLGKSWISGRTQAII
ncbi:Hypothetical predicted protein [Pelobates cultripes]|uniref:Uncharacterized protein n=1 Tax=Pelobates cultripes TaxID=61616 RepID=A0AAD1RES6_PELCU|nr:Hypothetical predicted protein [Pelobates cultripes]